jgi:hypothetical protein
MEEFKKALADYFTGWELVAFLDISIADVLAAFPDEVEDNYAELAGEINYGEDDPF